MKNLKATPEVKAAVMDWYQRKRELGTQEQLAFKLGISVGYVIYLLSRARHDGVIHNKP